METRRSAHRLRHHGRRHQAQAHAQFASNVIDYGMNIQAALEAPRFTRLPRRLRRSIEVRVPKEVREGLEKKGHYLNVTGDYSGLMGGGQAVMRDSKHGVNYAASSPRKDGEAIPEPDPYFAPPPEKKAPVRRAPEKKK